MDLGCVLSLSVWVVLISALGAERSSIGVEVGCQCLGVPSVDHTESSNQTCFLQGHRFRYKCEKDYLRKAGTSNLIKCSCPEGDPQCSWTSPSLICIRDPRIIIKQPQNTSKPLTTPPGFTDISTDFPHDSTFTSTTTAPSTCPQTTQSLSPSASVTTETSSTEPTSLESDQSQVNLVKTRQKEETTATPTTTTTTTTTTTKPPDIRTANSLLSANLSSETKAGLSCALLVIICALCGMAFWSYRRKSKLNIPPEIPEVEVPMNPSHRTADSGMDSLPADAAYFDILLRGSPDSQKH